LTWQIEIDDFAKSQIKNLDKSIQARIAKFIDKLMTLENPKVLGDTLRKELHPLVKYRIGDYRLICKLENKKLILLVLFIGHRSSVYEELTKYLNRRDI